MLPTGKSLKQVFYSPDIIYRWESNPFLDGDSINTSALTYTIGSDSIIEGAPIAVGGKNKTFLSIFTIFFLSFWLL